jgi:hypothetical protein
MQASNYYPKNPKQNKEIRVKCLTDSCQSWAGPKQWLSSAWQSEGYALRTTGLQPVNLIIKNEKYFTCPKLLKRKKRNDIIK